VASAIAEEGEEFELDPPPRWACAEKDRPAKNSTFS
jgi:hypothetical protein